MFKVICIDGSKRIYSTGGGDVIEGEIYIVTDVWDGIYTGLPYYSIEGYPCIKGYDGFRQDRFAPLSNIDETELLKQREDQFIEKHLAIIKEKTAKYKELLKK